MIAVFFASQIFSRLNSKLTFKAFSRALTLWAWMLLFMLLPMTHAFPDEAPFPDIPFKTFSHFISQHFSSKISLSTVLVLLFSLTENPDVLNLHARQQYCRSPGENQVVASGWIKGLAWAIKRSIDQNQRKPLKMKRSGLLDEEEEITVLGGKLDGLARLLDLHPYDSNGRFKGKLKMVSQKLIQPVYIICPSSMECETASCQSRSLHQIMPTRDIPQVTLIKNSVVYSDVHVLTGQCPTCKARYSADHE